MLASRAAYNSFVLYHNFRHAIDVLQSVFAFLLHIAALPPYGEIGTDADTSCPIACMLKPFDSLTLLISAIGHDVGHPGVNNFFLVKLNAPLAQLYNDNSVLEAFHCAAFSQILRRYWPAAFKDKQLRNVRYRVDVPAWTAKQRHEAGVPEKSPIHPLRDFIRSTARA